MESILYSQLESSIIVFIQSFMSEFLVSVASVITELGDETAMVCIVGLLYWCLDKDLGKRIAVYIGIMNITYPVVKCTVKRLRPYMADRNIKCLKPVSSDGDIYDIVVQEYSFPSGHANNSIAVYGTIGRRTDKKALKILMPVLIVLIGVSRFALGVHYPSDVLAGWIIAGVSIAVYNFLEKRLGRNRTFILYDIIGLAGFFVATTNDFYTGYGILLGTTLAIMFEEKYVNFEGTQDILHCFLRVAVGAVLFLGLNTVMKLPFSSEFLNSGTTPAFALRAARYAINMFLLLGVYPLCFKRVRKNKPEYNTVFP